MRLILLSWFLLFSLFTSIAPAGEAREIDLTDGSTITGEVQSLNNGIYTIRSESLGTVRIEDSKIRAMRLKSPAPAGGAGPGSGNTANEVRNLRNKMAGDKEIMALIQSLQNDPDFKKILEDPDIMKAVQEGDVAALTSNPKFMKLLDNSTVKEIEKKAR